MDSEKARECTASIVFEGRYSRHGWERRPRSFLWNKEQGKEEE